ncbi:MAG: glutamate-1-semialdehyde 2,1-aminomutase [Chitinophagales bacterium]
MKQERSKRLFEEALELFPGGVSSPVRAFRSVHGTPLFIASGKGSHITDEDGNTFLDFCCSWGPLIHGHADDRVIKAVSDALQKGTSFGTPTKFENALAKLILSNHPYVEQIRFVSSGTEAVMSAIRLARGYTGKNKIIKFEGCYHGHSDGLLVKAGSGLVTFGETSSKGIPKAIADETIVIGLDAEDALHTALDMYGADTACVIIEPVPANNGLLLQRPAFLQSLRAACTKHKVLLLFDEVISGFRIGFTGATGYYDVQPDIITLGKIIGGGLPVGAFAANKEIMQCISPAGAVYQAGTLSGNPLSMSAGIAQLEACLTSGFYTELENKTDRFLQPIKQHIQKEDLPLRIQHIGSIFWFAFEAKEAIRRADQIDPSSMRYFKEMHSALLERGIYLGPSGYEVGFVSSAHSDAELADAAHTIMEVLSLICSEAH